MLGSGVTAARAGGAAGARGRRRARELAAEALGRISSEPPRPAGRFRFHGDGRSAGAAVCRGAPGEVGGLGGLGGIGAHVRQGGEER